MSRERAKGTRWETKVTTWLRDEGFRVFRQPAHGINDKGDLHVGRDVIIECKDQARHSFAEWADEASTEAANAGRPVGIVCAHRRGKGSPADAYWILDGRSLAWLLREAGVELDTPDLMDDDQGGGPDGSVPERSVGVGRGRGVA